MYAMLGRTWRVVRPLLMAYLIVVLIMTFLETWLVYPAPQLSTGNWQPEGFNHQDVWFDSADGTRLHGWLFEHPSPQHIVLYCHGNGELVAHNVRLMSRLRDELDATVMVFDYRGYGNSVGKPHEAGVVADGIAAQKHLAEQAGVEPDEIVLMGRSLGGGVAAAAAAKLGAKAVVLQSTFACMVDTAAVHYPWLPVRLVMRNRYDSVARLADYDGPVLQSHGTSDEVIPYSQAQLLFKSVKSDRKLWYDVPDGLHNTPQPDDYYPKLREFLDF
ncbi:alpha/beta hydrolase [Aeoliella sp. ICT_H6.2]|uniref:Alpha/beta hydrolase n=1 Tax=Aeoliella straminimaris TaxID=2954799 RepID=A0A9X2JI76_9BACT|nr:alpha/beta hydrolase [Aeoliella straminimaris]MCO6046795.1 alpha/beta hydrolase [Aeoliella straminimaris]